MSVDLLGGLFSVRAGCIIQDASDTASEIEVLADRSAVSRDDAGVQRLLTAIWQA